MRVLSFVRRLYYLLVLSSFRHFYSPRRALTTPSLSSPPRQDRVPNIRFNVAKLLERLAGLVDASVVDQVIRPTLIELTEDSDTDVRFFAHKALTACEGLATMT